MEEKMRENEREETYNIEGRKKKNNSEKERKDNKREKGKMQQGKKKYNTEKEERECDNYIGTRS